jgi:two-component system invasion response regulator UvrY
VINVQLVDDHAVVRSGFRRLLEDEADIAVVAESANGEQAYRDFFRAKPDVLVMDISMPGISGLEAASRILRRQPDAKILILSMHEDGVFPSRAIDLGIRGYISKSGVTDNLITALREIASGRVFIEPLIAQKLSFQQVSGGDPVNKLTPREFEIFCLLAQGKTVMEIAGKLYISPKTAGAHRTSIMQKLDTSNVAELTLLAIRHGLINA